MITINTGKNRVLINTICYIKMTVCVKCGSTHIIHVSSILSLCDEGTTVTLDGTTHEIFIPRDFNIGGGNFIDFQCCNNCGQMVGIWPIKASNVPISERDLSYLSLTCICPSCTSFRVMYLSSFISNNPTIVTVDDDIYEEFIPEDFNIGDDDIIDIKVCADCGHVFGKWLMQRSTDTSYLSQYEQDYDYTSDEEDEIFDDEKLEEILSQPSFNSGLKDPICSIMSGPVCSVTN